ncbi:hypothetical protein NDU88_002626 [Pleurodeles waltl]|uniref:Uncharacterized protein n=1 Tax=Pleurodeles waltl TaxID=8319 RepID=A0AAV7TL76_PLEWA|nr:hypothetical protein NDU88_002626 [Pleurodeles waltl]
MVVSRPPGTPGTGQENTPLWNTDIRITVVKNRVGHPRQREEDAEVKEQMGEDDAGTEGKTVQEDAETGERRNEGPHKEQSHLEQLTPGENLNEGQGSPETPILRHVPGGAALRLPARRVFGELRRLYRRRARATWSGRSGDPLLSPRRPHTMGTIKSSTPFGDADRIAERGRIALAPPRASLGDTARVAARGGLDLTECLNGRANCLNSTL